MTPDYFLTIRVRGADGIALTQEKTRRFQRVSEERMKGLEPSTFCMASRPERGGTRRQTATNGPRTRVATGVAALRP